MDGLGYIFLQKGSCSGCLSLGMEYILFLHSIVGWYALSYAFISISLDVEIFKQSPVLISMFCFVYHCTCNVFVIRVLLTSFGLDYHDVNVMFARCRFYDICMAKAVSAVTPSCISRGCSRSQEHH